MSKATTPSYQRSFVAQLGARLTEPRRFLQVVAGPRQVGKSTLVAQVIGRLEMPAHFVSADEPSLRGPAWIGSQWEQARTTVGQSSGGRGALLALDEIQKIPGWSETVKRLWDEDSRAGIPLRVVLLGSAPLLVQQGLAESLAGRFEILRIPHWSFAEMRAAFGFSLDEYLYFGGYPGAASLIAEPDRWRRYVLDALVETTIARDVLLMSRVDKPALLRRLFELGCRHSGQVLSYTKMLGQLHEAGNTTTLAHYLELLGGAGMIVGLDKYAGTRVRQRASSPKLQVLNNALLSVHSGRSPEAVRSDPQFRGRLFESTVGAHLANASACGECELFYWRERNREVDFVLKRERALIAIEVKSGRTPETLAGMEAFQSDFRPTRTLLVGGDGIPIEEFLSHPVSHWSGV